MLAEVGGLLDELMALLFTDVAKLMVNEIEAQQQGSCHKRGMWCGNVSWSEGDVEIVEVPTLVAEQV
jgi:hypothetical protein